MALTDEQQAELEKSLSEVRSELEALKKEKSEAKKEVDEDAGKKLPEESPEKAKINRDYAKSIQDCLNRIEAIEKRLGATQGESLDDDIYPVLKV